MTRSDQICTIYPSFCHYAHYLIASAGQGAKPFDYDHWTLDDLWRYSFQAFLKLKVHAKFCGLPIIYRLFPPASLLFLKKSMIAAGMGRTCRETWLLNRLTRWLHSSMLPRWTPRDRPVKTRGSGLVTTYCVDGFGTEAPGCCPICFSSDSLIELMYDSLPCP